MLNIKFFRAGLGLLGPNVRRRLFILGLLITMGGLLETVALGSIIPLITLILDPEAMGNSSYYPKIISFFRDPDRPTLILYLSVLTISLLIISTLVSVFLRHLTTRFSASCWKGLADKLMTQVLNTPYEFFLHRNASTITRIFYHDIPLWSRDVVGLILHLFSDAIVFFFIACLVAFIFPSSGLLVVLGAVVIGFAFMMMCRKKIKLHSLTQRRTADTTNLATSQIIAGLRDIKTNVREDTNLKLFNYAVQEAADSFVWNSFWSKLYPSLFIFCVQIGLVLLAVVLWSIGVSGAEIVSYMALAMMVSSRVVPAINRLTGGAGALLKMAPFVQGVIDLRDSMDDATEAEVKKSTVSVDSEKKLAETWDKITVRNLSFSYYGSEKKSISEISTQFEKGKLYGLAGSSGSGKTTFVNILLGLLVADKGEITIGSQMLSGVDQKSWLQQVGYVPQNPYLIDGTLAENIAFSFEKALINRDRVKACLDDAYLSDMVSGLQLGIDTKIGEGGSRLSGGQRQRVAIARALYKQPKILVMDEATSSLDSLSEEKITDLLAQLKGKITCIVIAHRISSLLNMDKVMYLKDGRLEAVGNFDELMSINPGFAEMVSLQRDQQVGFKRENSV